MIFLGRSGGEKNNEESNKKSSRVHQRQMANRTLNERGNYKKRDQNDKGNQTRGKTDVNMRTGEVSDTPGDKTESGDGKNKVLFLKCESISGDSEEKEGGNKSEKNRGKAKEEGG